MFNPTKKHILLITTGGTIASVLTPNGLRPEEGGEQFLNRFDTSNYIITIRNLFSLDSTNIEPEEWSKIAECIYIEHKNYDGIVITHGTDTMAYTASALTFMLPGIHCPVVLTGSQLPITHPLSDAPANLQCAFAMAASGRKGIFIAFDRKVFLGCRAVKVRTTDFSAFESVNLLPIAVVNATGLIIHDNILSKAGGRKNNDPFALRNQIDPHVAMIKLIPGTDPALFANLEQIGYRGVVIEAFGSGGINFNRRDTVSALKKLVESGISVVVCSQCLYETTDMTVYEVGRKAMEIGAISAGDMTSEAAITKLMWALGQGMNPQQISELFSTNLHGEISVFADDVVA